MKTYLLGAAAAIFLSVIVSLLVPEGQLNKSITFIMRLVCILVLIQPLTGIFKIGSSDNSESKVDYTYIEQIYSDHQSEQLEKLLEEEFETDCECAVKIGYTGGEFKAQTAEVIIKENNSKLIDAIYEYLQELGYINITVYAEST